MNPRLRRSAGAILLLALVAAACGGGGGEAETTTTATTQPATTTSTEASTTTTSDEPEDTTTTTTVPPDDPVMPLSGEEILDEELAVRPALVVKIDNSPRSRPQTGLNDADIVFEENVEQITRFAAAYHSTMPEVVGPVRSGRTQDVELLASFNRPLFSWSGGNPGVTAAVRNSDLRDVGALTGFSGCCYYRDSSRSSPYNLYARGNELMSRAPDDAGTPPQQFRYRQGDNPVEGGEGADALRLSMDGIRVQWDWDAETGTFLRTQGNNPHTLIDGSRINARNVVVLFVEYRPSPVDARSPEAQTVGEGIAWVFTDGQVIVGTWSREEALEPFELLTDDGEVIRLTPGRTWVELSRADRGAIVPAGVDPASIPFP